MFDFSSLLEKASGLFGGGAQIAQDMDPAQLLEQAGIDPAQLSNLSDLDIQQLLSESGLDIGSLGDSSAIGTFLSRLNGGQ